MSPAIDILAIHPFLGETFVDLSFVGVDGLASLVRYIRERVSLSEKEYISTYPAEEDLQITRFPAFMKILWPDMCPSTSELPRILKSLMATLNIR